VRISRRRHELLLELALAVLVHVRIVFFPSIQNVLFFLVSQLDRSWLRPFLLCHRMLVVRDHNHFVFYLFAARLKQFRLLGLYDFHFFLFLLLGLLMQLVCCLN
jgi:hypothetical protein